MATADTPFPAESDDPAAERPAAHRAVMRTRVRIFAGTAAVASLSLALTTILTWATGPVWRVDQPQDTTGSVLVSADVRWAGPWGGPDTWSAFLLVAIQLAAAALAGLGALRRRRRLVRLSAPPAAVAFAATWALIVGAYFWGGIHQTIDTGGHLIPVAMRPRPRIEAAWPAALLFSAVALAAEIGAWWGMRRGRWRTAEDVSPRNDENPRP